MGFEEWMQKYDSAQTYLSMCMEKMPDEPSFLRCMLMLKDLKEKAIRNWPPSDSEKESNKLGWYSVRNIEEIEPVLHKMLSEISYEFDES